jgi:hypothetical protein
MRASNSEPSLRWTFSSKPLVLVGRPVGKGRAAADELARGPPGHLAEGRIDVPDDALAVDHFHARGERILHCAPERRLRAQHALDARLPHVAPRERDQRRHDDQRESADQPGERIAEQRRALLEGGRLDREPVWQQGDRRRVARGVRPRLAQRRRRQHPAGIVDQRDPVVPCELEVHRGAQHLRQRDAREDHSEVHILAEDGHDEVRERTAVIAARWSGDVLVGW